MTRLSLRISNKKIQKVLEEAIKLQSKDNLCNKIYCTTCGGLAHAVSQNLTNELKNQVDIALSELSISEFKSLGEWGELLRCMNNFAVKRLFSREEQSMDKTDIRQLDRYLLDARKIRRGCSSYEKLLFEGIKLSIETTDESLIETVSIIVGEDILKNKLLFDLALEKSKSNKKIHRVLYNLFRGSMPEVRGYVGDGNSVPPC